MKYINNFNTKEKTTKKSNKYSYLSVVGYSLLFLILLKFDSSTIPFYFSIGAILVTSIFMLITKRKNLDTVNKYLFQFILFSEILVYGITNTKAENFVITFAFLAIAIFYNNVRYLNFSIFYSFALNNIFIFTKGEFDLNTFLTTNLFLITASILFVSKTKEYEKVETELKDSKMTSMGAESQIKDLFYELQDSIGALGDFSSELNQNINNTNNISDELKTSFTEIMSSIEVQNKNITGILQSIESVDGDVKELTTSSDEMENVSNKTMKVIQGGINEVEKLADEMNKISQIIKTTIDSMKELNGENKQIEKILVTINEISSQTNLLALNASIEAARAGEHGRGFQVVAQEIKKLADLSKESTSEIAEILRKVQEKTKDLVSQVDAGEQAIKNGEVVSGKVQDVFKNVSQNTEVVLSTSNQVKEKTSTLRNSSNKITNEVISLSNVTEENTASLEEVKKLLEKQSQQIGQIAFSFKRVERQTKGLQEIIED